MPGMEKKYNCVGFHPLYQTTNQGFFRGSIEFSGVVCLSFDGTSLGRTASPSSSEFDDSNFRGFVRKITGKKGASDVNVGY